jgi:hypothetical protein
MSAESPLSLAPSWEHPGVRLVAAGCCLPPARWPSVDDGSMGLPLACARAAARDGEESALDMAVEASRQALDRAGTKAGELDLIISKSLSPSHLVSNHEIIGPRLGHPLQRALGAGRAFVFDLLDADWCVAIDIARGFVASLGYRRVLIVHAEASRFGVLPDSRSGFTLIDGAGAILLARADGARERAQRSSYCSLSDGAAGLRIDVVERAAVGAPATPHRARAVFAPQPGFLADARRAAQQAIASQPGSDRDGWLLVEEQWLPGIELIEEGTNGVGRRLRAPAELGPLGPYALPYHAASLREAADLALVTLDLTKRRAGSRIVTAGAA